MNRIALIGAKEGWCPQFAQATYRRWLPKGRDPSGKVELTDALREIGQDSDTILALAASEDVKAELNAQTNAAKELGISGSPTFVTPDEIFWGDDRLTDAIQWHLRQNSKFPQSPNVHETAASDRKAND
jgi:2-hydroxychromene-2-carboxylate isomerase